MIAVASISATNDESIRAKTSTIVETGFISLKYSP